MSIIQKKLKKRLKNSLFSGSLVYFSYATGTQNVVNPDWITLNNLITINAVLYNPNSVKFENIFIVILSDDWNIHVKENVNIKG